MRGIGRKNVLWPQFEMHGVFGPFVVFTPCNSIFFHCSYKFMRERLDAMLLPLPHVLQPMKLDQNSNVLQLKLFIGIELLRAVGLSFVKGKIFPKPYLKFTRRSTSRPPLLHRN